MTFYMREGSRFRVTAENNIPIDRSLPVGTYSVKLDQRGYFLDPIDNFEMPPKLYGNTMRHANRIFNTFMDRTGPTGVMLTGEKGSGKTLLAKKLSMVAAEKGYSTLVISNSFTDNDFFQLIQNIDQPAVVLFDEFEKIYDSDDQESILTLLDGVFPTKKLFVLTCNDKWRVDSHMRNRPGRIYYMLDFDGLDITFIREYCRDNLVNKDHIERVCAVSTLYSKFNFDMLKAIVEEMNRYNETPQEALQMLNASPQFEEESTYDVELYIRQRRMAAEQIDDTTWSGNPLDPEGVHIRYWVANPVPDEKRPRLHHYAEFGPEHLNKVDPDQGMFTYTNASEQTLVLRRQRPKTWNYYDSDAF